MRHICWVCFLLIAGLAPFACADETHVCPVRTCQGKTCPHSTATANTTIELDVRVVEINASKLRALGFDFAAIHGPVGSGFTGFLEALDREGLVGQDVTLTQQVVDGESWETILRWRVSDAKGTNGVWRTLRLRIGPTLLHSDGIRLDTACAAQFSKTPHTARHSPEQSVVDFGAEINQQTLCLTANFVGVDPGQFPKDAFRVVVLITPHRKSPSEKQSDCKSCPDLLAPRNVLSRHAARAR